METLTASDWWQTVALRTAPHGENMAHHLRHAPLIESELMALYEDAGIDSPLQVAQEEISIVSSTQPNATPVSLPPLPTPKEPLTPIEADPIAPIPITEDTAIHTATLPTTNRSNKNTPEQPASSVATTSTGLARTGYTPSDFTAWLLSLSRGGTGTEMRPAQHASVTPEAATPSAIVPSHTTAANYEYDEDEERYESTGDLDIDDAVQVLAQKSLADNTEIATETLAKLLVMQGKYGKAIRVYEQLILKMPEKITTFADRIKELRAKL